MIFQFPIKNRTISINRALYALAQYEKLVTCFRRVFAECNFHLQKENESQMVHYPRGLLDKMCSFYIDHSVIYHSTDKFMEADVFVVQFLSSGNPLVTGVALRISLKFGRFGRFNEKRQKEKAEIFFSALGRLTSEYGIDFVDYDDWSEFTDQNPQYKGHCGWDSNFLLKACPKFKAEIVARVRSQEV